MPGAFVRACDAHGVERRDRAVPSCIAQLTWPHSCGLAALGSCGTNGRPRRGGGADAFVAMHGGAAAKRDAENALAYCGRW